MLKKDARTAIRKSFLVSFFSKKNRFLLEPSLMMAQSPSLKPRSPPRRSFDHLDTDKEGTLDAHELTGLLGPKMGSAADTDHDKTLDHAKYLDVVGKAFARADADHDGTLDPAELSTPAGRELVAMLAY